MLKLRLLVSALCLLWAPICHAADPPTAPLLRIETAMHTAGITRIGVDAAERLVVTASDDKTVRVWERASGRLLRTLRPPLGNGDEGKIYAVAISPDGETIACGGWTGWDWDGTASIYLFERASGRLVRRIGGLPNMVLHLAFAPDGARLAATSGDNGVRVFRTADGALDWGDDDYGDGSYSADFDARGRLVTTSWDSMVRLYDAAGRLAAQTRAPGGTQPYRARFSPDGTRVAVGFIDSTRVNVLSGQTLALLYEPHTRGVDNGNLGNVAWSRDGRLLFAGGRWNVNGEFPLRRWQEGGRGAFNDLKCGATNTLMDIQPLRDGSMVWGAGDPAWGVLSARGERLLVKTPPIADYRDNREGLQLSATATSVRFGYSLGGENPARFEMAERALQTASGAQTVATPPSLAPPRTQAPGLAISDWFNTTAPKLNGQPLKLEPYEMSRSLALLPRGDGFVLGTEWWLRRFDRAGKPVWEQPVPGVAWSVNVSGDGRLVVAAYGDGTIRWHRLSDGAELLALFPHPDRKRWVLWTPEGFYDASPGGEDLIGWHLNNGRDRAADFFPASRFRDTFYRPDVVARVLQTLDRSLALKLADAARETERARLGLDAAPPRERDLRKLLPPVVNILAPADVAPVAAPAITVRYTLRTPSGRPVTEVRALVDGRPVVVESDLRLLAPQEVERTVTVPLPDRDCTVALIAENALSTSEPSLVIVRRAPVAIARRARPALARLVAADSADDGVKGPVLSSDALNASAPPPQRYRKLWILAIGVNQYQDAKLQTLNWAAQDARDFVATMREQQGTLYDELDVQLFDDEGRLALLEDLDAAFSRFESPDGADPAKPGSDDLVMIFLSGHGANDPFFNYHFLPRDFDSARFRRTTLSQTVINNAVKHCRAKVVVFLDTCRSGNVVRDPKTMGMALTKTVNELTDAANGAVVFTASRGDQNAVERREWNNGAFTEALLRGLHGDGDAANRRGEVSYGRLGDYLHDTVLELTKNQQEPTYGIPKLASPFVLARKPALQTITP